MNSKQRRVGKRKNRRDTCYATIYMLGFSQKMRKSILESKNITPEDEAIGKEMLEVLDEVDESIKGCRSLKEIVSKLELDIEIDINLPD